MPVLLLLDLQRFNFTNITSCSVQQSEEEVEESLSLSAIASVFTSKQRVECPVSTSLWLPLWQCEIRAKLSPDPDLWKQKTLEQEAERQTGYKQTMNSQSGS